MALENPVQNCTGLSSFLRNNSFRLLLLERGILQDFPDQVLHVFFPVALAHGEAEVDTSLERATRHNGLAVGVGNGVFAGELEVALSFGAHGERVHLGFGEAGNFEVAHGDDETRNAVESVKLRGGNEIVLLAELGRGHGEVCRFLGREIGGDVGVFFWTKSIVSIVIQKRKFRNCIKRWMKSHPRL